MDSHKNNLYALVDTNLNLYNNRLTQISTDESTDMSKTSCDRGETSDVQPVTAEQLAILTALRAAGVETLDEVRSLIALINEFELDSALA